ncbi:MAG TPA: hypothetical protein VF516_10340, partial [Kofleriaceae bacterium]
MQSASPGNAANGASPQSAVRTTRGARDPAIAEPVAEAALHPVDALRTNARGLAADLTLAGVGVGR